MPYSTFLCAALGAVLVLLLQLAPAAAQANRFVATTGSDSNNCTSLADACRTLQRAHDVADTGGKVVILDSGDFSTVTITKSIAIVATGVHANLFTGLVTKITIDAGPDAVIDIDGLAVGRNAPSGSSSNSGIDFISGGRLNVRNCTIRNFNTAGIYVRGGGAKRVVVSDCTVADNQHGIWARGGHEVFLDRVTVAGNVGNGVRSQGNGTRVRINRSTVTNNGTGLKSVNGGRIISFGNNAVHGNGTNGAPTATAMLK